MLTSIALLTSPLVAAATAVTTGTANTGIATTGTVTTSITGPVATAGTALAHWGPWAGGPGGGFGFLFLLIPLFWIGLIALIISLAARRRRRFWAANGGSPGWAGRAGSGGAGWGHPGWGAAGWGGANPTADAEKTLAERFARGDIDEVEYRARLEVLQAGRPTGPVPHTKS